MSAKNLQKYACHTIGRRKSSTARIFLAEGKGDFHVNSKPINDYFSREIDIEKALQPLKLLKSDQKFDLKVTVKGGGNTGQAGAVCLGVARALVEYFSDDKINEEVKEILAGNAVDEQEESPTFDQKAVKKYLKSNGLLTRDARQVERKKLGRRKARKSKQFSKR
jgi:small subunit ribosomal protein S9